MKTIDDICLKAAAQLRKLGCEDYTITVKDPDSKDLYMLHNGNKIFNIGACEMIGDMIKDEVKGKY